MDKTEDQPLKGHFNVKKVTRFSELKEGEEFTLPESDLCFQNGDAVFQFDYVEPKEERKFEIKPGIYSLVETAAGVTVSKTELRSRQLLEQVTNTSAILKEARTFFSRLHVYERLGRIKKRGVLLYSAPGMGKTSAIEKFCHESLEEDKGTVIMIWPTSQIEADSVGNFLSRQSEFTKDCTRLVLIIEDIGGGERHGEGGRYAVTSGLLNLLDGVGVTFKLPTFIVATTNHPENLLSSLADRPGRFDLMLKLNPPSDKERIALLEFVAKRPISEEERAAITMKGTEKFSIAHLEEVVVRAELHDKTYAEVVKELIEHAERFNKNFNDDKGRVGFGGDDW